MTMFFLAQSLIICGVVIGAYVGTKVQIARLEVHVSSLKEDHSALSIKLHGMSRNLAELTGKVHGIKS